MDKTSKLYMKAMNEYHEGHIEKALELCERSISLSLKNAAALNLKGLLLYLKGDLEGAKTLWRLNKDINKDEVSKKYLIDNAEDEKKKLLYNSALALIKEVRVKEAVELLEKCAESDFNIINVANAMAACLIKQGKYEEAEKFIERVLTVDVYNKEAKQSKKLLIDFRVLNTRHISFKRLAIMLAVPVVSAILMYGILNMLHIKRTASYNSENVKMNGQINTPAPKENKQEADNTEAGSKELQKNEEKFPFENIKKFIEQKKFYLIYEEVAKWREKNLDVNEKALLNKGEELLKTEGVGFFYASGTKNLSEKDYNKAQSDFIKAYDIGKDSYLLPHITYMLGYTYEKSGDIESSLKFYESYMNNYSSGDYAPTVLYNLVMLYKDTDINKSKEYARHIAEKYPQSIYNNSNVKEVLSR